MSYQGYGGNPYGSEYEQSGNPYGGSRGSNQHLGASVPLQQQTSNYSQTSSYSQQGTTATPQNTVAYPHNQQQQQQQQQQQPQQPYQSAILSNQDFLSRVDGVRQSITRLSSQVQAIAAAHQRAINATDGAASSQVDNLVSQTQVLNTQIKDQIKFLETDAAKSGSNATKDSQIRNLKNQFTNQLQEFRREEESYKQRYQEQIARQYRIVNPEATQDEVREASEANWGDEGVFQTALKSNRSAAATSVLGTVRARHNDIQKIEQTMLQLNQLFEDLAEQVIVQDTAVQAAEEQTGHVVDDTENANVQLGKGVKSARRARKLKWWCLGLVVLIILVLALALGLYFGVTKKASS